MPISSLALDEACGAGRIRQALNPNEIVEMDATLERVARLIPDIERRKLVFPEIRRGGKKGMTTPKYVWLEPPAAPPKIPSLALESAWSLWAACVRCGFNQFLPVVIDNKPHVCCYRCTPPSQRRAIGATPVKKSLIHEALKKFY